MQAPDNTNQSEPTRSQRREQAAADALRGLIRDILQDKFPDFDLQPAPLSLNLSLELRPGETGALRFTPPLREQMLDQTEVQMGTRQAFLPGTVYDFHAQSHALPGCRPPDARSVFAGYDPLGHPKWSPVTDLIRPGETLRILSGKDMKSEQLAAFGKNDPAFNILGQLIVGPSPVPEACQPLTGSPEFALSVQIVETRDPRGRFALASNLLCGGLLPDELTTMLQDSTLVHLRAGVVALTDQLARLERQALLAWTHQDRSELNKLLSAVPKLLAACAARFSPEPDIPSPFPAADLAAARDEDWFWDAGRRSWILNAGGHTAHAFAEDGGHLTSFALSAKLISQRLARQRWETKTPPPGLQFHPQP